jgi:preprotein translocase subunit YajC
MDQISLLLLGGMLLVFWLLIIRPQSKQQKLAKEFQTGLDKGARVVTSGGIHGKVIKSDETTVLMEVDNNVKLRIDKSAISMEMTKAAYGETEKKADAVEAK